MLLQVAAGAGLALAALLVERRLRQRKKARSQAGPSSDAKPKKKSSQCFAEAWPTCRAAWLQEPASPLGRPRIAVVATGSVASVKIPELVEKLSEIAEVTVLLTAPAEVMTSQQVAGRYSPERYRAWEALQRSGVHVLRDIDEWDGYEDVSSDSVVHIELRRWADVALVAPCSANTLAKLALGLCDNLATSFLRAWDPEKPLLIAPAMNTLMWEHPSTAQHLNTLQARGSIIIPPISKKLACGDVGRGALASVSDILQAATEAFGGAATRRASSGIGSWRFRGFEARQISVLLLAPVSVGRLEALSPVAGVAASQRRLSQWQKAALSSAMIGHDVADRADPGSCRLVTSFPQAANKLMHHSDSTCELLGCALQDDDSVSNCVDFTGSFSVGWRSVPLVAMLPAFCRVVSRWSSGQLPRALLRTLPTHCVHGGGHARGCAGSQRLHLVTSEAQGREACAALTQGIQVDPEREDGEEAELKAVWNPLSPTVALDCEGVRLGRFGRICLLQLQDSKGQVLLCDALRTGVVKALAPLLESRQIVKVIHDCREDSAALFHQHGIQLRAVFDTQAAHSVLEKRAGREAYQASASELLKQYLHIEPEQTELKSLMLQDPGLWARRPLSKGLVRYALHSVSHLRQLHQSLVAAARQNSSTSLEECFAEWPPACRQFKKIL